MRVITEGGEWEVSLRDGSVGRVWADGYQEIGHAYDFGVLLDSTRASLRSRGGAYIAPTSAS